MRVEVINTGTELLLGNVVNTHLAFLAQALFPLGLRIERQVTVPDGDAIREALVASFESAGIVLVTGGLGPTSDDITRDVAAALTGRPLRHDSEVEATIAERFRSRGFKVTDRVMRQAMVPEGAVVLPNRNGTAPGLYLPAAAGIPHVFLLPGPPRELRPMFEDEAVPRLKEIAPRMGEEILERQYRLVGIGESHVEELVGVALEAIEGLELGYCARPGEVDVRCIGTFGTLETAGEIIEAALGIFIATRDKREMEEVVVEMLRSRRLTVATAESCTGGFVAHRLTNVPGASEIFLGGFVTYSNESKTRALGVDPELIARHGAVSAEVAAAMASGARSAAGADFAVSTTGIAGPGGGTEGKPVGTVFLGIATPGGCETHRRHFRTDRETFKWVASQTALDFLRRAVGEA